VTVCGLGLAHLLATAAATPPGAPAAPPAPPAPIDVVAREDADRLFRLGWRLLHERTGDPARALLTPPAARR
jgi:hypothetical protein